VGDQTANVLSYAVVAARTCTVSFKGVSGIRHSVDVEAETLYEAAVLAVQRFRQDIWGEAVAPGTALEVEVREPGTKHSLTLQQVERWLAAPGTTV
jgi:hypothetical protein